MKKELRLIEYIKDSYFEMIEEMLEDENININFKDSNGVSPLLMAYKKRNLEVMEILLDEGADINLSYKDNKTLLIIACEDNNEEVVNLLLAYDDIDIEHKDNFDKTALSYAKKNANNNIIKIFENLTF